MHQVNKCITADLYQKHLYSLEPPSDLSAWYQYIHNVAFITNKYNLVHAAYYMLPKRSARRTNTKETLIQFRTQPSPNPIYIFLVIAIFIYILLKLLTVNNSLHIVVKLKKYITTMICYWKAWIAYDQIQYVFAAQLITSNGSRRAHPSKLNHFIFVFNCTLCNTKFIKQHIITSCSKSNHKTLE